MQGRETPSPTLSCCERSPWTRRAAVMDGGLLGARETAYASRATLVVALGVYGLLSVLPRAYPGLFGVWLSLKGLSTGRTLAAGVQLAERVPPDTCRGARKQADVWEIIHSDNARQCGCCWQHLRGIGRAVSPGASG